MRAVALTLLIPKCIHEVLALLLDAFLQASLPQAKISEGGQSESPLLLPQVPTGREQSCQRHDTVSQGRSLHQGEKAPGLCLISSLAGPLQGHRFDFMAEICVLRENSPLLLKIFPARGISGRSRKFSPWFTRTSLTLCSPLTITNGSLPMSTPKMSPYFSISWEGKQKITMSCICNQCVCQAKDGWAGHTSGNKGS